MLNKTHTKYIQSLHLKKFRDEFGEFIAEGSKVVTELLQSNVFTCRYIIGIEKWISEDNNILQKYPSLQILSVKDFELEKISALTTPNNVLAVFKKKDEVNSITVKQKITLVLDGVQDPGNFGTIVRTADWFGVENIICSDTCADMYNSKVVQSTMGSLARINILYTDLERWLKSNTVKKYATTLNGKPLKSIEKLQEAIVIIGNEGRGISDAIMQLADEKITITKIGEAESLNAAVATGIILAAVC